jgi:hypothetical protein
MCEVVVLASATGQVLSPLANIVCVVSSVGCFVSGCPSVVVGSWSFVFDETSHWSWLFRTFVFCAAVTVLDCQVHRFSENCCLLFLHLQNQAQAFSKRAEQEVEYTELDRVPPDIFLQIGQISCVCVFVFCVLGPEFQTLFVLCFSFKFNSSGRGPSCVQESAELNFVF